MNSQTVVKRETKNRIRVDFERTSFWRRMRMKYLSTNFLVKVVFVIFRLVLLIGISYVILFPFFSKISSSFMSSADFNDQSVRLIPRYPTLDTYKAVLEFRNSDNLGYFNAMLNTFLVSVLCGVSQTLVCSFIGYGFAKFKFKGNGLLFVLVILTMVIPHQSLKLSMYMHFRYFDFFGLFGLLGGDVINGFQVLSFSSINMINTYLPLTLLSLTGLAFKNGLYIFMMRQFFRGVPDELEESSYLDGAGNIYTFFKIILPLSIPMMVTIFLFSFCWQWTDQFYTNTFFTNGGPIMMPGLISQIENGIETTGALHSAAIINTTAILIILPLIILYLFGQKFLVQGIERSGIVG